MNFYIETLEYKINANERLLSYKKRRPFDILNKLPGTYSVEMKLLYSDPNNSLVQAGSHSNPTNWYNIENPTYISENGAYAIGRAVGTQKKSVNDTLVDGGADSQDTGDIELEYTYNLLEYSILWSPNINGYHCKLIDQDDTSVQEFEYSGQDEIFGHGFEIPDLRSNEKPATKKHSFVAGFSMRKVDTNIIPYTLKTYNTCYNDVPSSD